MAKSKEKCSDSLSKAKCRPARTPEEREKQMIALAMDRAEQQIRDGTASSQVLTHFLQLGSEKKQLELEKLREENKLLRARTEALQSAASSAELYMNAIKAFQSYTSGAGDQEEVIDDE